jgi:hypothetical protein
MAVAKDINQSYAALSDFVNKPQKWAAFNAVLDKYSEQQQKKLLQSNELVDVYRAQGAIEALNKLRFLKEEVNGAK